MALACDTHPVQNLKVLRGCGSSPARGTGDRLGGMGNREGSRPAKP